MKKRKRKKRTGKKFFKTVFVTTYVSFICFLYLFATRVTPWDIDYFINDTKQNATQLVSTLKTQKAALEVKREAAALAKAVSKEKKKTNKSNVVDEEEDKGTTLQSNTVELVYYSQTDPQWNATLYGTDNTIGVFGCGPTH